MDHERRDTLLNYSDNDCCCWRDNYVMSVFIKQQTQFYNLQMHLQSTEQ